MVGKERREREQAKFNHFSAKFQLTEEAFYDA